MKFCAQGRKHALLRALMRGLPAAGGKRSEVEECAFNRSIEGRQSILMKAAVNDP